MINKDITPFEMNNGSTVFGFPNFDEVEDYYKIINIIKTRIMPDVFSQGCGLGQMYGTFEKDNHKFNIIYDDLMGNYLEYSGNSKAEVNYILEISRLILSELLKLQ